MTWPSLAAVESSSSFEQSFRLFRLALDGSLAASNVRLFKSTFSRLSFVAASTV